ncbi:MAG TPA: cell division protein ZapA [Bacteroidota bacterium]|nr:cell division protein ZapA [Bacteroidota bacterium]
MATDGKSIKVKIFGSEYPLRGESEEMTKKVAGYVDEMISSIHDKIPEQPPLTVAVLSALNITEELFKEQDRGRSLNGHLEDEAQRVRDELVRMNDFLDHCLVSDM